MYRWKTSWMLAALVAVLLASPARAQVAPDVLARNTTNEVLRIVKQDKDIKNGNNAKILSLVEQKVLPNFDFEHMTQLAVGKNWPRATAEQKQALVNEFRTMLVRTYSSAISSVADYRIDFKPFKAAPGADEVTVNTEVSKPGAPPIPIDYRMEKRTGDWKVFDVLVDNVSLVTVYRNSFNSEVRKNGIDGLVAALQRRNRATAN
ncbi:MAG TPA: ABC transporter substrate-binding protein [Thiobacillaceae bacterium]|nr:ABC transporter substrate-binding protein [Thiobacillaceae bacterium]HNU63227.1 ABC transporter substrate-binding protein [Thiobacillaceae bacterium]